MRYKYKINAYSIDKSLFYAIIYVRSVVGRGITMLTKFRCQYCGDESSATDATCWSDISNNDDLDIDIGIEILEQCM